MGRILVTFWSGTGNTELMADAIAKAAKEAGAEVDCRPIAEMTVDAAIGYDAVAIGCPSMGQEVLEENDAEPFVEGFCRQGTGRKVAIFGSYGWGDGEWMRNWADRMRLSGCQLLNDGVMAHETPDSQALDDCAACGRALAEQVN